MPTTKTPNISEKVSGNKKPVSVEVSQSYYRKSPSWRFSIADHDHPRWTVLDSEEDIVYDPADTSGTSVLRTYSKSIDRALLECLKDRESMTWSVLLTQSGGRKRGTNSHHIPMYELVKEAQERATEIGVFEDELLSLRLDGTHRIFGILDEHGVLNIIWFDRNHEICPVAQ